MSRPPLFSTPVNQEIDLRVWFDNIVYGTTRDRAHGKPILIRRMRKVGEIKTECTCLRVKNTIEADPKCSYCLGEGYLWDESWHKTFNELVGPEGGLAARRIMMGAGEIRVDYKVFYLRYDTPISYGDKLIEVDLDLEGKPRKPTVRRTVYRPETIDELRSDNGRVEFLAVYCKEKDAVRRDV